MSPLPAPSVSTNAHAQPKSQLFVLPTEVRLAIYARLVAKDVHIFLRKGHIAVSRCVEPNPPDNLDGSERAPAGDGSPDSTWARRLLSAWGPHWKCEEIARQAGLGPSDHSHELDRRGQTPAVFLVCKRMFMDISCLMAASAVFNVTDLETLEHLINENSVGGTPSASSYCILNVDALSLVRLNLTLRLALSFFQALEEKEPTQAGSHSGSQDTLLKTWARVWPSLAHRLKNLQILQIWLDHDDVSYWSDVNERPIFSLPLRSMTKDTVPGLRRLSINLPFNHPSIENPERHFARGDCGLPAYIAVHRRLRQRHFPGKDPRGNLRITYGIEFPTLYALPGYEDTPLAELERIEREQWESGQSLEQSFWFTAKID